MVWATSEYFFNWNDGYVEGLCRGFKGGILKQSDYSNLRQCESLEDVKLHLQSTDYGGFLANEAGDITLPVLSEKLQEHYVNLFETMRTQAVEPLNTFFDYICYGYMIDNIILLITGTLHGRDIAELFPKCHPLGMFESIGSLYIATTPAELYNSVLIDTPIAPYFLECISSEDLNELNIEIIRNKLYKAYLEDFARFCEELGNESGESMKELLQFEADRRAFIITVNSFDTELTKDDRSKLYPKCGKLFPEGLAMLGECEDYDQVRNVASYYPDYRKCFEGVDDAGDTTLEDLFYQMEVHKNKLCFLHHFNLSVFYSFVKLKEQECRNIIWIAECISQKHKSKIDNYVPIF